VTFEEFFKKKKIDLAALEKAEPGLFSEFKTHFEQMGEKSFDHTKKYWFNKLRLIYHLAPEVKEEKVVIENKLAEQTITESLLESSGPPPVTPAPNVGFKPRFKPGMAKPAAPAEQPKEDVPEKPAEEIPAATPPPNVGFKPRFKAGVTKPVESKEGTATEPESPAETTEPTTPPPAKVGFTPWFKAGVTKPATPIEPAKEELKEPPAEEKPADDSAPKPAYKPRFNMKNIKPKGEE
jgi:hypothetical protein